MSLPRFGFVSCVSLNSNQTGKTVGEGNISFFGNYSGHINDKEYIYAIHDSVKNSNVLEIVEIGTSFGIKENFDLGVKVNSSFYFMGTSKLQFIGNKQSFFASSAGLNLGVGLFLGSSFSSSLSLYNSIHPTDYLGFYLSPKYVYYTTVIRRNRIYGYSAGIIVGKTHQFSFEVSQFVNNSKFSFHKKQIISLGYV